MKHPVKTGALGLLLSALTLWGCGDDEGVEGTEKLSAKGESCAETLDCEEGLTCVELICMPGADKGTEKDVGKDAGADKDGGSYDDLLACKTEGESYAKDGTTYVCTNGQWTEQP